jgi:protein FAM32A
MSDYDFRPGGSLKLKGGVAEGGIVKKWVVYHNDCFPCLFIRRKKKKSKVKSELSNGQDLKAVEDLVSKTDDKDNSASGSNRNSPALAASSSHKTEAEKRFEEVQKRRVCYTATYLRFRENWSIFCPACSTCREACAQNTQGPCQRVQYSFRFPQRAPWHSKGRNYSIRSAKSIAKHYLFRLDQVEFHFARFTSCVAWDVPGRVCLWTDSSRSSIL